MSREYAARRLLEHGPLCAREFRAITGWPRRVTNRTLETLTRRKQVKRVGDHRGYLYELAV